MTRRLLALLAILSGLAALHAPAQAASAERLSYDVQALAEAAKAPGNAIRASQYPPRSTARRCPQQPAQALRVQVLGALAPALVVGVDRALE